ncbi:MAG: hypothetical protein KAI43_09610 [Candidatus Aureabacteria bacterium]|nr:hypothetical protein [Candidatus Auribacterota bacterium]
MIVKIKKITILGLAAREKESLKTLRDMGIMHIKHVQKAESADIEDIKNKIDILFKAIIVMEARNTKVEKTPCDSALDMAKHVQALMERKAYLQDQLQTTIKEIARIEMLGDFSPIDIDLLKEKNINIKLYRCSKKELSLIDNNIPYEVILKKGSQVVIFTVSKSEISLPFEEIELPLIGLNELKEKTKSLKSKIDSIEKELNALAAFEKCMKKELLVYQEKLEFNEVRSGMGKEEQISYLQGYCPTNNVVTIKDALSKMGWAILIEDPGDEEDVPTLIKNPKWLRIIEPVFEFMSTVPGYREYDISLWFLISLSLFFAMLIGDGGYGAIFLFSTFLMRRKFRKAPAAPFTLFYVFSIGTIIWGALTGVWFGAEIIAGLPVFKDLIIPKLSGFAGDQNFVMQLCFTIGIIHITIAHLINIVSIINSIKALAQVGWICIMWSLYFLVGNLILGKEMPGFTKYLLIAGILLAAAFANPKKNFILSFILGLVDLPLNIISSFGDIVSYIRLFAVGYASLAVAMSFNGMAANLGWGSLVGIVGSTFVLFIGHGLNIVLGLMAVVVHGVRLNMLEFSGHLGMTWSGYKFNPFKSKTEKLKV